MTTTAKELMMEALQSKKNVDDEDDKLYIRIKNAETEIANLEEEYENKKAERPALLADCKDISKLNKRLKEIEEAIEINNDLITGVTAKQKEFENTKREALYNARSAYTNYIDELLGVLSKKYQKVAKSLSEILLEYVTLEQIQDIDKKGVYDSKINASKIKEIPNLLDEYNPFFQYKVYEIYSQNKDKVMKKYDIPEI